MNHIPVAYATEKDYVGCTVVSMQSIIESANKDSFFVFYILVDESFSDEFKQLIIDCFQQYKNQCIIKFKIIGDIFDNAYLSTDFIKRPTYYRLLLPQLLEEEKCIYLDSDTIICGDLHALYDIEIEEDYIGGVKAPEYIIQYNETHRKQALLPTIEQYINAGVLLINLKQMRKDNVVKRFLDLLPLNMITQDQDIINSVCYDKITFLPFWFNVMTKYAKWKISDYANIFSDEELKEAWNNPQIIHYADRLKPWNSFNCPMGEYWWGVCKRSKIWHEFYEKMSDELIFRSLFSKCSLIDDITTKGTVELFDILYKKKLVIYGAGDRAKKFIQYLKKENVKPEFILVTHANNNPYILQGIEVKELRNIMNSNLDTTVVIATSEKYHVEILTSLQYYKFREIVPLSDNWNLDIMEKVII